MTTKIYKRWGASNSQELQMLSEVAKHAGMSRDSTLHGYTPEEFRRTASVLETAHPGLANYSTQRGGVLNTLTRNSGTQGALIRSANHSTSPFSNGTTLFSTRQPFQPEVDDPSHLDAPIERRKFNDYAKLFHRTDPLVGTVLDMISMLPWSDFQLTGEGVDGEIKEKYEYALRESRILHMLQMMTLERSITGDAIPQLMWDNRRGAWVHCALHDPNTINVVHSPLLKMDPILEFVPDDRLRQLATSSHPMLVEYRKTMPSELLSALRAGRNIPLSPVNASIVSHKAHDYDVRGTSVFSRLWRVYELEYAYAAASIATARRAASPIKLLKLGEPTTNTMVSPQEEQRLHSLLAQAEADPVGHWLIWNHQISHELLGAPERVLSLTQHYGLIEQMKLTALGVSKGFLTGEASYSSAAAGLTLFMQRLKSLREHLVNEWLIPKFFLQMAVMNNWRKTKKKSASLDDDMAMYIVPTIEWSKALDSNIDKDRLDAFNILTNQLGLKVSDQRKFAVMGIDHEEEQRTLVEELQFKKDLAGNDPEKMALLGLGGAQPAEGGGGGMMLGGEPPMVSPAIPPESFGMPPGEPPMDAGETGAPPPEGEVPAPAPASLEADASSGSATVPKGGKTQGSQFWPSTLLQPVKSLFESMDPAMIADAEPWADALKDSGVKEALEAQSSDLLWDSLENWMMAEGYPNDQIADLGKQLGRSAALESLKTATLAAPKELIQLAESFKDSGAVDLFVRGG